LVVVLGHGMLEVGVVDTVEGRVVLLVLCWLIGRVVAVAARTT